ncbi:hypothetical protein ACFFJX_04900 [Pseudarcicella hirudinis]
MKNAKNFIKKVVVFSLGERCFLQKLLYLGAVILCLTIDIRAQSTYTKRIAPLTSNSSTESYYELDNRNWAQYNYLTFGSLDTYRSEDGYNAYTGLRNVGTIRANSETVDWASGHNKYGLYKRFNDLRFGYLEANGDPCSGTDECPGTASEYWLMTLLKNGNVGIGTTTPGAKLEVNGQLKISGGTPGSGKILTSDANGLASWQTLTSSSIGPLLDLGSTITGRDGNAGKIGYQTLTPDALDIVGAGTSTTNRKIKFWNEGGATFSGRVNMTQTTALMMGGGATTIAGNEQLLFGWSGSGFMHAIRSRHNSTAMVGNALDFYIWKYGTDAVNANPTQHVMTLDGNGNVGIGTTTPGAKLEVNGQLKITGGTPGNGKVLTSDANGLASWQTPTGSSSIGTLLDLGSTISGREANAGKIGYQTFTSDALDIIGAGTSGTNRKIKFWNEGGATFSGGVNMAQTTTLLKGGSNTATTGNEQLLFGFNGTANYMHAIRSRHNGGGMAGNALDFYTWKQGTDATAATPTQHVMTLDGNGRVGIGTTTPVVQLEVGKNVSNSTTLLMDVHGHAIFNNDSDSLTSVSINTDARVGNAALTVGGPTYIGGWRGIEAGAVKGDYLKKYNLWVQKGVVSEDFVYSPKTIWKDEVFQPGYLLPELPEVEKFIQEYRHLPGIPSEQEVRKDGYSSHNLNTVFLEK